MKIEDTFRFREEDFGGLIINIKTAKVYKINKTGFFILDNIAKSTSKEGIINGIHARYSIPIEDAKKDFDEFVERLNVLGVINDLE